MMNILVNIAEALTCENDGSPCVPGTPGAGSTGGTIGLMDTIVRNILNPAVQVLIAVAVVLFLFGIVKYITSGDDEAKRKEAKNYIIYGIVGLFVMVSVWGLVGILTGTFGTNQGVPDIPNLLPAKK
jgi:hypothetical protein